MKLKLHDHRDGFEKKKKDMNDSKMIFFKNVELCSLSSGHLQGGIESGWLAQIESAFYYSLIINTLCDIAPRSPPTDASRFLQGCMFRWIIMEWCDSLLICSQIKEAQIDHAAAVLLEIQSFSQEHFRWSEPGLLYRLTHTWCRGPDMVSVRVLLTSPQNDADVLKLTRFIRKKVRHTADYAAVSC